MQIIIFKPLLAGFERRKDDRVAGTAATGAPVAVGKETPVTMHALESSLAPVAQ